MQKSTSNSPKQATTIQQYFQHRTFLGIISELIPFTVNDKNICETLLLLPSLQKTKCFINAFNSSVQTPFSHMLTKQEIEQSMTYNSKVIRF